MNIQKNELTQENQTKCKHCKTFYACQAYQGHCSSCFKKLKKEEQFNPKSPTETIASPTLNESQLIQKMEEFSLDDQKKQQKDRKRCFACNKKVGLLGIQCKCGYVHCNSHRLPQEHNCQFDHLARGKQQLKKQIVKVYNGKIAQI